MSLVVSVSWQSLTRSAEVSVVANNTLVTDTLDVSLTCLVLAERTVAVDASVVSYRDTTTRDSSRLIELSESVARVSKSSSFDAVVAIIKVWAGKALVTNTTDVLNTSVSY